MGSPKKRHAKVPVSPRQSKSSLGIIVTAGLLLVACAIIFSIGLILGMNSGPSTTELDRPATDHLLRVSGHSPFSFSRINLQETIQSISSKAHGLKTSSVAPLNSLKNSDSVDTLLSNAVDTSKHDQLMAQLYDRKVVSETTTPPLAVKAEPEPVKVDTIEHRIASMKREPVVLTKDQIEDRQAEIRKKEAIQEEVDAIKLEQLLEKRQAEERVVYEAAIQAVGQSVVDSAPPTWRLSLGEDVNFANTVKNTVNIINQQAAGPMEAFVRKGGRFPVAVLAANRPDMLKQTLQNLLKLNGAQKEDILVFQDGSDGGVASVARSLGFDPIQHIDPSGGRSSLRGGKPDGAVIIAAMYKFALSRAMQLRPEAPGVIVVEDDFLFSPDFLEFFHHTAPIIERDPTTFILSAWNDNGLKGKVYDRSALCRTLFFPGLGWLLPRRLWEEELSSRWPKEHWDHWLRDPKRHKGRESVYPEVNRDYHAGKKGTFMDDYHHNRYFKDIDYDTLQSNKEAFQLTEVPTYLWGMKDVYEARLLSVLNSQRTLHVSNLDQLSDLDSYSEAVLWHRTDFKAVSDSSTPPFKAMADYFNIWHEWPRTAHDGSIHHFRWGASHTLVLLVNLRNFMNGKPGESPYSHHRPLDAKVFEPSDFHGKQPPLPLSITKHLKIVKGSNQGESCIATCRNFNNYKCEKLAFSMINNCQSLKDNFPCEHGCEESYGLEQPAYVFKGAPPESLPGTCLYTSKPAESTCEANHPVTTRICPCVPP